MSTTDNESWVEKHRPETWGDLQGNNSDLREIRDWCESWSTGDEPLLLIGPPGVGKTSTAWVIRDYMGWNLNQVNASTARKTEDIRQIASAIRNNPYEGTQFILLDEVDGLYKSISLDPLKDALSDAPNPIMLTANDKYEVPRGIKSRCKIYEFSLGKRSRQAKLKEIIKKEDLDISTTTLARLSERPDLRSAINDLQMASEFGGEIDSEGDREWDQSEFEALDEILSASDDVDIAFNIDPDDFIWWLDQNWRADSSSNSKNIRGLEIAVAFDAISRSDKYLNRAFSTQEFRYKKYSMALQEATGKIRLTEPYGSWIDKNYPKWFRMSSSKPDDSSGESKLYREIDDMENNRFRLGGDYTYFKEVLLPLLQDLPKGERLDIAVNHSIRDESALDVLDIKEEELEDWRGENDWEESTMGTSAMDW